MNGSIPPSMIYAYAAARLGIPYANGAPNLSVDIPAMVELSEKNQAPIAGKLIELWDWPLRLFHWALVVCVSTALVTGWLGGGWMPVHALAGETIVGLLVFRISWGFFGSSHARFHHFLPTPAQIRAYLTGQWSGVGHNPLGALSVLALLKILY